MSRIARLMGQKPIIENHPDMEVGSGNVFADLGLDDADILALKSEIKGLREELAETAHWRDRYHSQLEAAIKSMNDWGDMATDLSAQLAAEKALADRLSVYAEVYGGEDHPAVAAYRKARGL